MECINFKLQINIIAVEVKNELIRNKVQNRENILNDEVIRMVEKIPLEYVTLHFQHNLCLEDILKKDEYRIISVENKNIDQYIVDDDMHLIGLIDSKILMQNCPFNNVNSLIKRDITCIVSNKYEKAMAEGVFSKSLNINSIPVVDQERKLLYVYQKTSIISDNFVQENEIKTMDKYSFEIKKTIEKIEGQFYKTPVVLTDIFEYKGDIYKELKKYLISIEKIENLNPNSHIVVLAYLFDYNSLSAVRYCIMHKVKFITCNLQGKHTLKPTPYFKIDRNARDVLTEESYKNSDYFDLYDFQNIFQALNLTRELTGDYVEIGTYRGDSARAALSYMKKSKIHRKAWFFDTYEGFTYNSAESSSDCFWVNTHTETSIEFVRNRLSEFSNHLDVQIMKRNIITEELPSEIDMIAVCNIDVDMYEAVSAALLKVMDKIVLGGIIIAEDYGHTPFLIGAQLAITEFYEENKDKFWGLYMQSGQFLMIRK